MYWTVPPVWKDGQCVIIGGGASVPKEFGVPETEINKVRVKKAQPDVFSPYMEAIHNEHTIAINMSYKLGTWHDIVFFGDGGFLQRGGVELLKYRGLKITCAEGIQNYHKHVRILRRSNKRYGIDFNPNVLVWNFNSGAAAINLAVHLGVKRIILLGFDMTLDESKRQHWHNYYSAHARTVSSTFRRHMVGFDYIAADLKGKIEILNASPKSKIGAFPKVSFNEIKL